MVEASLYVHLSSEVRLSIHFMYIGATMAEAYKLIHRID